MEEPALREIRESPASRKTFLRMVGVGGAGALATLIAACGSNGDSSSETSSSASTAAASTGSGSGSGGGDLAIASYALTLEYLEADFYKQAAASGMLKGQALELGKEFGEQEQEHVAALEKLITSMNGKLPAKPTGK